MKLLIVDDNFKMREMLKSVFKLYFTEIRECDDGESALSTYQNFMPDWVFMDIEMKNTDGITASKRIIGSFPKAKIIIITSYDNPELKKMAGTIGIHSYILKENMIDIMDILESSNN